MTYSGTIATRRGNSSPAVNSEKIAPRPRNSYRAMTKAAVTPRTTAPSVVPTATNVLLSTCTQNTSCEHVGVLSNAMGRASRPDRH